MIYLLSALTLNVAMTYFCGQVALHRGRSVKPWLWLGALFGPFALVIVALLPSRQKAAVA